MNTAHLRPCPSCDRHARVSEDTCPFCGAAFDWSFRSAPRPRQPSGRLTRAALVTLGTSAAAVSPGCALLPKDHAEMLPQDGGDADIEDGEADVSLLITEIDSGLVGTFYGSAIGMTIPDGMTIPECRTVQGCETVAQAAGGSIAFCCVQEQCIVGQAALDVACEDPQVQMIQASSYDQSCNVDTDCIAISEGNFCVPGAMNCSNAAINKGSKTQYLSDVANTNAAFCSAPGSCGAPFVCDGNVGPWCVNGTCTVSECPPAADAQAPDEAGHDE